MTTQRTYQTRTGRVLTDSDIARIAAEVETTEYDIEELKTRRRGRPLPNSARPASPSPTHQALSPTARARQTGM